MTESRLRTIIREETRRLLEANMGDPRVATGQMVPNPDVDQLASALMAAGYDVTQHANKSGHYVVKVSVKGVKVSFSDDNDVPLTEMVIGPAPTTFRSGGKTYILKTIP